MDNTKLQETTKRLLEINDIIKQLDSTIRPAAFALLQNYAITGTAPKEHPAKHQEQPADSQDNADFFLKFKDQKPSDNVLLVCADYYSQYGSSPFKVEDVVALADKVGVTIPNTPHMTLKAAQRKGKALFRCPSTGVFAPTVHGEEYFKKTFGVKKGTQKREIAE